MISGGLKATVFRSSASRSLPLFVRSLDLPLARYSSRNPRLGTADENNFRLAELLTRGDEIVGADIWRQQHNQSDRHHRTRPRGLHGMEIGNERASQLDVLQTAIVTGRTRSLTVVTTAISILVRRRESVFADPVGVQKLECRPGAHDECLPLIVREKHLSVVGRYGNPRDGPNASYLHGPVCRRLVSICRDTRATH